MLRNRVWAIIYAVALILVTESNRAKGEELHRLSRTELRRLVANARKPADYQTLALYFHYREQAYRAKAYLELRDYARYSSRYHPRGLSASDNAGRLYEYYSAQADRQAEFAAPYDLMLLRRGIPPPHLIQTISLTELQGQSARQAMNSLVAPETPALPDTRNLPAK